jgi:hypothetical protein
LILIELVSPVIGIAEAIEGKPIALASSVLSDAHNEVVEVDVTNGRVFGGETSRYSSHEWSSSTVQEQHSISIGTVLEFFQSKYQR